MKVEVVAEVLEFTDKNNVRSTYLKGQVFDMDEKFVESNLETVPRSADGMARARTAMGGRPSVKMAPEAAKVQPPAEQITVKPAPAPKVPGMEAK